MDWNSATINGDSGKRAARRPGDARCDQLCLHRSEPARRRPRSLPNRIAFSRASAVVARIFDVYAALDGAVTSHYEVTTHPEIFDGFACIAGQSVAVIRHNASRDPLLRARDSELFAAHERDRHLYPQVRRGRFRNQSANPGHTQNRARTARRSTNTPCVAAADRIIGLISPTAC